MSPKKNVSTFFCWHFFSPVFDQIFFACGAMYRVEHPQYRQIQGTGTVYKRFWANWTLESPGQALLAPESTQMLTCWHVKKKSMSAFAWTPPPLEKKMSANGTKNIKMSAKGCTPPTPKMLTCWHNKWTAPNGSLQIFACGAFKHHKVSSKHRLRR